MPTRPQQVYRFLGLSVGLIQADMKPPQRMEAYACDVTYVTNQELGFDFLRDNLAMTAEEVVLRGARATAHAPPTPRAWRERRPLRALRPPSRMRDRPCPSLPAAQTSTFAWWTRATRS